MRTCHPGPPAAALQRGPRAARAGRLHSPCTGFKDRLGFSGFSGVGSWYCSSLT